MFEFLQSLAIKVFALGTAFLMFLSPGSEPGVVLRPFKEVRDTVKEKLQNFQDLNIKKSLLETTTSIQKTSGDDNTLAERDFQEKNNKKLDEISKESTENSATKVSEDIPPREISMQDSKTLETEKKETIVSPLLQKSPQKLLSAALLNNMARNATVNILCLTKSGGIFEPIVGSGVIIDERGVILTNAHVAQFFLLKDYRVPNYLNCVIRTGSPAKPTYKAEILYISPTWIEKNAEKIASQNAEGTGEHDYALLYINGVTNNGKLPDSFPALNPHKNADNIKQNNFVLLASYPAGFLGGITVTRDLWITTSISSINKIFTFGSNPSHAPDIFSVKGTIGAQEGSSGGAVLDFISGDLLGIIVTRTVGKTTIDRELRILSIPYINSELLGETSKNLKEFLSGNLSEKSLEFSSTTAPKLSKILTDILDK